jgi:hypothetical protein
MAKLKAQNFELEFSYHKLNTCDEIEYMFDIKLDGKPFFNPDVLSKKEYFIKNGKFIFSDCWDNDWLMIFFIDILKTRKGGKTAVLEPPELDFEVVTWENRREEREKSWEGRTIKTSNENGEIVDEPSADFAELLVPLWENQIDFKIHFPGKLFDTKEYTCFTLSLTATFSDFVKFVDDFVKEMYTFYQRYTNRIKYLGNGEYEVINHVV